MPSLSRLASASAHSAALLAALGGTGEGWEFQGGIIDHGGPKAQCACGHVIRFGFMLEKEGRKPVQVGSVCVENAPGLRPGTVEAIRAALDAALAKERERERAHREALQDEAIRTAREAILAECTKASAALVEARRAGGWAPQTVYDRARLAGWARAHVSARLKSRAAILRRCEEARRALFGEVAAT